LCELFAEAFVFGDEFGDEQIGRDELSAVK
jgi:hypothetical protein